MSSDAGLLLLAQHAVQSGDIARIAAALAPKLNAPAPGERKSRAPSHSTTELITQRVMQLIGGYPDGNDSNLLRNDPVLQMLVGKAAPGTANATLASQPTMSRGPWGGAETDCDEGAAPQGEGAVRRRPNQHAKRQSHPRHPAPRG
jgi:hypothetical protein